MAENQINYAVDGQELSQADVNGILGPYGLMDDRVFAELLRMPGFDGTNTYKSIIPYGQQIPEGSVGATYLNSGTVQTTGLANGSVNVNPFRCVIGSRVTAGTSTLQNYRDIRTSVSIGVTTLVQTLLLANNSSGNPRWDLVYAVFSVDAAAGSLTRRIKNPTTGVITTGSETTILVNTATVGTVTGTPAGSPLIPALPADGGGLFYVAIAAVLVPTGFTSASTVVQQGIRDLVGDKNLTNGGGQTVAAISPTMGVMAGPFMASSNNDRQSQYSSNFPWTTTPATARSPLFLPPSMIGGVKYLTCIDTTTGSPSHSNGSIVDDTIDWRKRFTLVFGCGGGLSKWAMDPTAAGAVVPTIFGATGGALMSTLTQPSNTMASDGSLVAASSTIFYASNGASPNYTGMASGSIVGLYVLASDGILRWFANGTVSGLKWTIWIEATQQYPNF